MLWACAGVGLLIALAAAGYVFLGTQRALDFVVARTIANAAGHLTIEGARGSLLSTINVSRIAWKGEDLTVEALDAALAWSPWSLLSRRVVVRGLGARSLTFELASSDPSAASGPPASLELPLEVEVRHIAVQRLEWRTGAQGGYVAGVAFGYAGGASAHRIHDLQFITQWGTLTGEASIAARPPYAIAGALAFVGDNAYEGGRADVAVSGTLEELGIGARGTWRTADIALTAGITPFATALVKSADIKAHNVDLAQFLPDLPTTALSLTASAHPAGTGFAGTLSVQNDTAGPIDAGRIPLASLATAFAFDDATVTLTDVDARLGEHGNGGRATGRATLTTPTGPVRLDLALANVDASRLVTTLIATRLSGTVEASVEESRQVIRADLRQDDLAADFTATLADRRVTIQRLRARAGDGTLTGTASIGLDAPRAFSVDAKVAAFDPSRFVAMPQARLDGSVRAQGTLAPPFAIRGDVIIAKGSRFAGLDVAATAKGAVTPASVRDAQIDATLGNSRIALAGGFGEASERLRYDVTVGKLAELRPLLARYATGVALPETIAGAMRLKGTVAGAPAAPGVTLEARGTDLLWGETARVASVDLTASIAPGQGTGGPVALEARAIALEITASKLIAPPAELASLTAKADGTLARHRLALGAKGGDVDLTVAASGGIGEVAVPGGIERGWTGTLDAFANAGPHPIRLLAPAALTVARGRSEIGSAAIAIGEGRIDIVKAAIEDGRIDTQGRYTGVPVAAVARMLGRPLPFRSTLVVGGDWSLAAAPRLNGTFTLAREKGDWFAAQESALDTGELALGIDTLELVARFTDDALAAKAQLRSTRAGNANASLDLGAGSTPGRIDASTTFSANAIADLPSLRPLQPWLGTIAVADGRLRVALAGHGTLRDPVFSGTLAGDGLRFDLPQYGVQLRDGVVRAHLAERTIVVDELAFAGGAGRFTATGSIAAPGKDARQATTRLTWQAQDFTLVNRPDLQLVADGKGTLTFVDAKVHLAGDISIEKGRIEYEPMRVGRLSDDVVIVGEPRRDDSGAPLPLALDLQVALGRDFRFSGEGLEARLTGRVHVTTTPRGALAANGSIQTVAGTYYLFGQRLDITRGRLIFDGPAGNPGLDVVALRRNLAVEAGVEISGTVQQPIVRLVSNPPVPDGEKLSWILTGQGLDRASRNDIALLGAASASLLGGGNGRPITTRIANTLGLDDISVQNRDSEKAGGASTQVVSFGKRLSDRLSLVYEQGLSVASNALRLEYALSRSLTLRADAGFVNSVGLYYRRTFH